MHYIHMHEIASANALHKIAKTLQITILPALKQVAIKKPPPPLTGFLLNDSPPRHLLDMLQWENSHVTPQLVL